MKKRLLLMLMLLGLSCSLAGCSRPSSGDQEAEDAAEETSGKEEEAGQTDEADGGADTNPEGSGTADEASDETAVFPLDVLCSDEKIYLVYSDRSIKKAADGEGYKFRYAKLIDGLLYVETYDDAADEAAFCTMDTDGRIVDTILTGYSSFDISAAKYQDKIYISYTSYVYPERQTNCFAFEYDPSDRSLKESPKMADAMQYISDHSYSYAGGWRSLITTLENYGEALLWSDGKIFVMDLADGNCSNEYFYLDDDAEYGGIDIIFGDLVLYHNMSGYAGPVNYYLLHFKSGEKEHMMETPAVISNILAAGDGCIYYSTSDSNDSRTAYVNCFDVDKKENNLIYTAETPPGSSEYYVNCGVTGAAYIDGRLYVQDIRDGRAVWAYYDTADGVYEYTDNAVHEYSYAEFGTVSLTAGNQFYDGTDEVSYTYSLEDFMLNDNITSHEVINGHLQKEFDAYFERAMEDMAAMKNEVYEEDGWNYYMSLDRSVSSVQKIGSHYLEIIFNLYDYGGGAHGYGWSDYLMYDLNSGEPVSLSTLTDIEEASYRELIAEKSMEVWKKGTGGFYTDYDDCTDKEREEMYQAFYDGADPDHDIIRFCEDGVILYYPPYLYGPYASGYIEVPISYEELGIDITAE